MAGRTTEYRRKREVKGYTPGGLAIIAKRPSKVDRHWRIHQIQKIEEMNRERARLTNALNFKIIRDGWMDKTDVKITENQIEKLKQQFYTVHRDKLEARRCKLRNLLCHENQLYLQAADQAKETPEQRDVRLLETAQQIKERNVARHLAHIKPLLDAQFTLACPEVRDAMVKQRTKMVAADCQRTAHFKQERRATERQFQAFYDKMWLEDARRKAIREAAEVEKVQYQAKDRIAGLLQQIDANEAKKEIARQDKINDHEAITYFMNAHKESIEVEREKKRRMQDHMRYVLDKHCELSALKKMRAKEEEDAIDEQMLERAKQEEAQAVTDEAANKRENAREYLQYLTYIRSENKKAKDWEREEDKRMAARLKKEALKQQDREENIVKEISRSERKLKAEQLEQIRAKEVFRVGEEMERERQKREIIVRSEREHLLEDEKIMKRKLEAMKHRRELEGQIAFNAQRREQEKVLKKKELEGMCIAEQQYQCRMKELMNRPPPLNTHPMAYVFDSQRFVFQSPPAVDFSYLNYGVPHPPSQ